MAGVGRLLGNQHRRLACNLTSGPKPAILPSGRAVKVVSIESVLEDSTGPLPIHTMPQVLSVSERAFGTVARLAATAWKRTDVAAASSASKLFSHTKETFSTLSGDPSNINPGDARLRFLANSKEVGYGNTADLCSQVECQTNGMRAKVLDFKDIYNERIRPQLQSRCLILPGAINDVSTSFLHDQTFKIVNHNASYIGCFDVMVYWSGCKTKKEWIDFINHLVDRKIYVIEDWEKSFSTVEVLMYDHGLKEPDDGTDEPFYKGECDASFDPSTKTARLAYIVWKDNKIIYAEVFTSLHCESAADAEIHAAMALLYKCEELGIRKLQVWSDSRTATSILTGEKPITMGHPKRDFYLMLRHMRTRFKSLVVTWKPRELMVFADFLTRAANLKEDETPEAVLRISLVKFEEHLRGSPVLRVERTQDTSKAVGRFDKDLAKSYGEHCKGGRTRYIIEVEEDSKFECLRGLYQSLEPASIDLFTRRGKEHLESLTNQFKSMDDNLDLVDLVLSNNGFAGGTCCIFRHRESRHSTQNLVVVYDYSIAENVAYAPGEFQVLLVTPSERKSIKEKVEELNALSFVYFNGIRE